MITNNIHIKLLGTIALSVGLVVILFLSSERQVHRNNAFTRRYPPHPVIKQYDLDIGFNSYYIAGFDADEVYLGNSTSPWHLLKVDLTTHDTLHITLSPSNRMIRYRSLQVRVHPPYFFVMDGTMPFILRGKLGEWAAHPWMEGKAYFSSAVPVDSNKIYIKARRATTQKSILGILEKRDKFHIRLDPTLLQQQIDGVFDVDGIMVHNPVDHKIGYVYYYRNQFMTMNPLLKNVSRHRTIDTVGHAQIRIGNKNKKGQVSMSAPSLIINKSAYMFNDLILIRSDRLGKNENKSMLNEATIIDVYNYNNSSYAFSFYIYNVHNHKAREFMVTGDRLVALIDDHISVYQIASPRFGNKKPDFINMSKNIEHTTGQ